jgi:hypothetical protein
VRSKSAYGFDEDSVYEFLRVEREVLMRDSRAFHKLAGLKPPKLKGCVVESAHQPLFAPPEYFFNKFKVAQKIADDNAGTFVFGFADNDFFLFNRMWRGEGKALSWNWYKTQPHHVSFNKIALPKQLTGLPQCKTLAEYNAVSIALRAKEQGFTPLYYVYSALPNLNRQIKWFVDNADSFRNAFNSSVLQHGLGNIKLMQALELPLWRVFDDGRKETVLEGDLSGRIEFKAVARGFAMSSFLKTWTYVAGRGEASSYGLIVDDVARALNTALPFKVVA